MKSYADALESYLIPTEEKLFDTTKSKLKKFGTNVRTKFTKFQLKPLFKILDKLKIKYDPNNFEFPIIPKKVFDANKSKLTSVELVYLAQMNQVYMNQMEQQNQQEMLMQFQLQNQLFQDQMIQNQIMQDQININNQLMQDQINQQMNSMPMGGGFGGPGFF